MMKTSVNRSIRFYMTAGLLLVIMALGFGRTHAYAKETRQDLFTLYIKDAAQTKKLLVSEVDKDGAIRIETEAGETPLSLAANTTTAKVKVKEKTEYFLNNYAKVSVKKKVSLSDSATSTRTINLKVKKKDGTVYKTTLTLAVPVKPSFESFELNAISLVFPGDTLSATVGVNCTQTLSSVFKISNSAGKTVYTAKVKTLPGEKMYFYWDGTAGTGNKAGLKAGETVPEGQYKLKVTVKYKLDGKSASVSKSKKFEVKAAQQGTESAAGYARNPWPWKVIVTGNKRADYLAEVVCRQILTPSMNEYTRCKSIYAWCVTHFTRESSSNKASTATYKIDVKSATAKEEMETYEKTVKAMVKAGTAIVNNQDSMSGGEANSGWYNKRVQGLTKQIGDCTTMAAMFECLCRHAGMECDIIENSLPDEDPEHHYWCVTKVDGKWYYNDPRMENARWSGSLQYTHLLRGKVSLAKEEARYGMIKSKYKALYDQCEKKDYGK